MDNLTHTATGLFLSRVGLNRLTPQASAILMVAANAPDIDVVSLAGGPLNYLHYHRHLTHSLIGLPVMAILSVLLVSAGSRAIGLLACRRAKGASSSTTPQPLHWWGAFAAACIGVASHLLLDFMNGYGIRLLLPFSPEYYRLEWTGLVDPWLWAAFFLAVAAPFLARLVGSEIASGRPRAPYPGRGWPAFALIFAVLYIGARGALHARAIGELESRIYDGAEPLRVAASPSFANPLRWRGIVETSDFYALPDVDLAGTFDPTRARIVHKAAADPAIDAAKPAPPFQVLLRFAQFPVWSVSPADAPENAKTVTATDVRFMGWDANALVDPRGRVLRAWFQMDGLKPR
jgi:inner membrane protein